MTLTGLASIYFLKPLVKGLSHDRDCFTNQDTTCTHIAKSTAFNGLITLRHESIEGIFLAFKF